MLNCFYVRNAAQLFYVTERNMLEGALIISQYRHFYGQKKSSRYLQFDWAVKYSRLGTHEKQNKKTAFPINAERTCEREHFFSFCSFCLWRSKFQQIWKWKVFVLTIFFCVYFNVIRVQCIELYKQIKDLQYCSQVVVMCIFLK